jgi:signal transduction histidine kinase
MPRTQTRPYPPWRGLTLQLFAVTILPLTVLLLAITFGSLAVHQNAMRAMVGERDERAVSAASQAIEAEIHHRTAAIHGLALQANDVPASGLEEVLSSNGYLLPDFEGGLAIFGRSGKLLAFSGDQGTWETLTEDSQTWIEGARSTTGEPAYISSAFKRASDGEMLVLVAASLPAAERIAAGIFSTQSLVARVLGGGPASHDEIGTLLIDASGKPLYQSGDFSSGEALDAHPGVAEALRGETGTTYLRVGEDEHVVAYAPVAPVGWGIVTEESWGALATPTLRTSQIMPLVLVPALLIAVVGLWFGVRQVVQPIQKLEAKAVRLAWGDFESIGEPIGGIAEVRHLQEELVQMAQKLRAAQQSLHDYIGAITRAQEDERRRLARELHDDTIQSLIALKQRVQLTRLSLKGQAAADAMAELESLAEQTINDLRRQTRALRPIYLEDLGLVTALEMLAQETSQSAGIPVDFHQQGDERRLSPEVELALYRMTQEALSNVIRHAQASQASVDLRFERQGVALEVSDNGQGFEVPRSPAEFAPSGHFGLLGLHERAELIGARLEIRSAPGKGTCIQVNMPITIL